MQEGRRDEKCCHYYSETLPSHEGSWTAEIFSYRSTPSRCHDTETFSGTESGPECEEEYRKVEALCYHLSKTLQRETVGKVSAFPLYGKTTSCCPDSTAFLCSTCDVGTA